MKSSIAFVTEEPHRRISLFRLFIAIFFLLGLVGTSAYALLQWQQTKSIAIHTPWFAPYVDVTATPSYPFEQLGTTPFHDVVLSFIVASSTDGCTPSWGNAYNLDQAQVALDLDRRIARLRQQGGDIAISFGGQRNNELAITCKNSSQLFSAYQSVIQRYSVDTIDFDIEGNALSDTSSLLLRAKAIALLQKKMRADKKNLAVWLTLPVTPQGLTEEGTTAVSYMLQNGVDLSGVNVMTMDYAQSRDQGQTMGQASENALQETHRQLGVLYQKVGISLSSNSLWAKIGATPMAGQNDETQDVFTLADALSLNTFATSQRIGRMSLWSANRDIQCGDNYVDVKIVSDSCSGIKQNKYAFSALLSKNFIGSLSMNASFVTVGEANAPTQQVDDPEKSPYQIWSESGAYLQGTKVVWHRNVYQAKWWTQGDVPDNPVLQSWQTPWQLVGPVLPGEKPIPQPTLPPGTYPAWDGASTYDAGQIVLFNGVPFQAKWWNQAESPAAASSNSDSSPWASLTQKQVDELMQQNTASSASSLY